MSGASPIILSFLPPPPPYPIFIYPFFSFVCIVCSYMLFPTVYIFDSIQSDLMGVSFFCSCFRLYSISTYYEFLGI
ncbi:hypothetical protein ASPWEDRAFT_431950 [Aspergillus wentii DTO 134E9]|uniref:Uncharacterized protein n=1 Tax=Aspergillus wentii DTO 134E9 TaxID=1073089 RepID=A0A1L9RPW1_ASPWE|nr:uncharacterized protein ASPWEDRAFT_431950 [Aspergillus wentii DTO 134E9]OJJ36857.1 hypothetical protein ASPWEDRAFT_431950 [Aspergillus wentii DTO 134E9]